MKKAALAIVTSVLLVPAMTLASRVTEQGEWSVRDHIKVSTGYSRIYFSQTKESNISGNESRVTGEGVASNSNGWGGVPFKYSVRVHRSSYQTRDISVNFTNGQNVSSRPDWTKPLPAQDYEVTFTFPRWFQTVRDNKVRFEGKSYGSGDITVQVYDRSGRVVREGRSRPDRNGTWAVPLDLSPGSYRAVSHRRGWGQGDEVRFAVQRQSGGWGEGGAWNNGDGSFAWQQGGSWGGDWERPNENRPQNGQIEITNPRNGDKETAGDIRFRGRANSNEVTFSLYDGDRRISRRTLRVRNGEWENTLAVREGRYRLVIESGRNSREINFTVGEGNLSGSRLEITNPREGDREDGGSLRFRGRGPNGDVTFSLYKGSSRVARRTLRVRNGEWETTYRLDSGRYRLVVESRTDAREISFNVK